MAVVNYSIYKVLGTLSENKDGMKKQLTCTSWGRYNPKFDIRAWDEDYVQMTKGVTLTLEEILELKEALEEAKQERAEAKKLEAEKSE